jgi:hypothetical protein
MIILHGGAFEGNAGWGAEHSLADGFSACGHSVYRLDYRRLRRRLYRELVETPVFDVFFLQRGDYFPVSALRSIDSPKVFWETELPPSWHDHARIVRSDLFDHLFFWTEEFLRLYASRGEVRPEKCSLLTGAFDPRLHRPHEHIRKDIDVLFVGSTTPRRERMLGLLRKDFKVEAPSAFGEDLVRLVNRARIVLNIHAHDHVTIETRVFEVLGCKAFLLSETLPPESPFGQDEVVQFDTAEEARDRIRYYLNHNTEREAVAEQGYRAASAGHTYFHRAEHIVTIMEQLAAPRQQTSRGTNGMLHLLRVQEFLARRRESLKGPLKSLLRPAKACIRAALRP